MDEDAELLRRYAKDRAEAAFAEIVRRHLDLVYAVALRKVGGDAHLAQDVAQVVFADVAAKAATLARHPVLTGWLFTSTHYAAAQAVRAERRRRAREEKAEAMNELLRDSQPPADWDRVRPLLDDLVRELGERDRAAVLLRYFEGRSLAEVGARLKISEEGARSRVDRAVDKLRGLLARRGVNSTAAALGVALASQAGVSAPAGLAASVTGAALAESAAGAGIFFNFMNTKSFLVASVGALAVAVGVAANRADAESGARREAAALAAQQQAVSARARALEAELTAAERRARAADADTAQLLKAVEDTAEPHRISSSGGSRLAFVVDTSGSMRNPTNGKLWSGVSASIAEALKARPDVSFVQVFDASGRSIWSGGGALRVGDATIHSEISRALDNYSEDSISNPVPGILRVLRGRFAPDGPEVKFDLFVIGDEFSAVPEPVWRQLDKLNPVGVDGKRRATISAVQLPTTIRYNGGVPANTGVKFQTLMSEVAHQHGGAYRMLSDNALR